MMDKFNPDTYCGIYCGACSIVMHGETGRADGFADCLGSVPKEDLACGGCKSDAVYTGCSTCNLRQCAREKGVAHCIDCSDYPCKMYSNWQSAAKFLVPHSSDAVSSLEAIKRDGVASWLAAQKRRWSCPDCGSLFSWYSPKCYKCGRSLASEAYKLSGWRKLLCRIMLPMAYRKGKAKRPVI
jgi:hypothetical protein